MSTKENASEWLIHYRSTFFKSMSSPQALLFIAFCSPKAGGGNRTKVILEELGLNQSHLALQATALTTKP